MTTTSTRKYKWGRLAIRANFAQASSSIQYAVDDGEFDISPFQVADARHRESEAFRLVREWLAVHA